MGGGWEEVGRRLGGGILIIVLFLRFPRRSPSRTIPCVFAGRPEDTLGGRKHVRATPKMYFFQGVSKWGQRGSSFPII